MGTVFGGFLPFKALIVWIVSRVFFGCPLRNFARSQSFTVSVIQPLQAGIHTRLISLAQLTTAALAIDRTHVPVTTAFRLFPFISPVSGKSLK